MSDNLIKLEKEIQKSNPKFFQEFIKEKTGKEINDSIIILERELHQLSGKTGPEIDKLNKKLNLLREYKTATDLTKNNWLNTFNHEFCHKADNRLSETFDIVKLEETSLNEIFTDNRRLEKMKNLLENGGLLDKEIEYNDIIKDLNKLHDDSLLENVRDQITDTMTDVNWKDVNRFLDKRLDRIRLERMLEKDGTYLSDEAIDILTCGTLIAGKEKNKTIDSLVNILSHDLKAEDIRIGDIRDIIKSMGKGNFNNLENKLKELSPKLTSDEVNDFVKYLEKNKTPKTFQVSEIDIPGQNSPFLDEKAWNITDYAREKKSPSEAMADTFKILMQERRRFAAEKGKSLLTSKDNREFLRELLASDYRDQYKYIIKKLLTENKRIDWPQIENITDYTHLLDNTELEAKWRSIFDEVRQLKVDEEIPKGMKIDMKTSPTVDGSKPGVTLSGNVKTDIPGDVKTDIPSINKSSIKDKSHLKLGNNFQKAERQKIKLLERIDNINNEANWETVWPDYLKLGNLRKPGKKYYYEGFNVNRFKQYVERFNMAYEADLTDILQKYLEHCIKNRIRY